MSHYCDKNVLAIFGRCHFGVVNWL